VVSNEVGREERRVCGVVKARVTSHQRLRVRIPPATRVAVAQMAEQWKTPELIVPAAKSYRDGAAQDISLAKERG
jgi:hypothetical protein